MGTAVEVFQVHREDPRAWRIMPQLVDRMVRFCATMDTESDPEDLIELLRAWFAAGDTRLGLWVGVVDDTIIGHAFATPEPLGEEQRQGRKPYRYVLIRQAEVDRGWDIRIETKTLFETVTAWAKTVHGVNRLHMLTHRSEATFLRRWGFQPYKAVMMYQMDD